MLNASVGFQRVLGRVRRPLKHGPASDAPREARRFAVAPKLRHGVHVVVAASRLAPVREQRATVVAAAPVVVARTETPARPRRTLISRLGHERSVAMVVVAIVVGASVISVSAGHPAGPTGNTNGAGTAPRIAIGGDTTGDTAADNTGDVAVSGGTDGIDATDSTESGERRRRPWRQRRPGHHRLHGQRRVRPARRRHPAEIAVRRHRYRRHRVRLDRRSRASKAPSSTTARWSSRSPSTRRSPTAAAWSRPTRSSPATRSPTSPRSSRSRR